MSAGIEAAQSGLTAEGDASVLLQKVAKDLITDVMKGERTPLPLTYCPKQQLPKLTNVTTVEILFELVKVKEEYRVNQLFSTLSEKLAEKSLFEIWMKEESDLIQGTAWAYSERMCAEQAVNALSQRPDLRALLEPAVYLYLLDIVKTDLAWFILNGVISPVAGQGVETEWTQAVKRFGLVVREVVEGFGVPDELIFAPAAGNLTEYYSQRMDGEHLPLAKL